MKPVSFGKFLKLTEEIQDNPRLPPIFLPDFPTNYPKRPPVKIPFRPDMGDEDPDLPPDFPPRVDTNGDGVVSKEEFLAYARQVLEAAGFSPAHIKILLKLIREGRGPTGFEKIRLIGINQELLKRLLKQIQREFPGGTPFVLPSDF
ncbi:EF-hand domain-containing protein [Hyphomonas sp.]|uniref:EF-hand domain-containing protein n=1 Tax=Hyphomonas sp. TaxID=87 RepID=UPI000C8C89D2|nr:EF-hand domain-containing protein [Hyphomonas sp.]MAL47025.1 hypothetical protein [Hyphomonas sp.]